MKRAVAYIVTVVCCTGLVLLFVNQSHRNRSSLQGPERSVVFRLGDTRDEVLKMAGNPPSQWDSPSGILWDIYLRKTSANEYKIYVTYGEDRTESRLHPTLRVSYVTFKLDHPRPVAGVLDDLPEAQTVCPLSCVGAVGVSGLTIAPANAKAEDPVFFTLNSENALSSPVDEIRLDRESTAPFQHAKPVGIVWTHR